jgi:hypothetical protein
MNLHLYLRPWRFVVPILKVALALGQTPPESFVAKPGDGEVTLTWSLVPDTTGFNVKRAASTGGPWTILATNIASTAFLATNLANGVNYYFTVSSVADENVAGTSSTDPDSVLRILSAERWADNGVVLTWSSVPGKDYRIARKRHLTDATWAPSMDRITATTTETTWSNAAGFTEESGLFRILVEP